MSAEHYEAAGRLSGPSLPLHNQRRWWVAVAILLAAAVFIEAVFAGAMLSGAGWARTAHRAAALGLIASTAVAALVAIATLRGAPHGLRLALTLIGLAAGVVLQAALGALSAHGANLLWLHVPVGVALVGLAGQAVAGARKLGGD
jgi:hypothetical protein